MDFGNNTDNEVKLSWENGIFLSKYKHITLTTAPMVIKLSHLLEGVSSCITYMTYHAWLVHVFVILSLKMEHKCYKEHHFYIVISPIIRDKYRKLMLDSTREIYTHYHRVVSSLQFDSYLVLQGLPYMPSLHWLNMVMKIRRCTDSD